MRQTAHPRPLVPLAVALLAGMALGERFAGQVPFWVLALGAAGSLLGLVLARGTLVGAGPPFMGLYLVLGYQLIQPWAAPRFPPRHIVHWIDTGPVTICGKIHAVLPPARFGSRFVLDCEQIQCRGRRRFVNGRVRVFARGPGPALVPGGKVRMRAILRPVHGYQNPGGFDYRRYLAMTGVWAQAKARGSQIRPIPRDGPPSWQGRLHGVRQAIVEQIRRAVGTGPAGAVLGALVVGERSKIAPARRAAFNRAGVGHLLAISGLHIGMVAAGGFFVFRWILAWLPCLLWRAWVVRAAAALALVPMAAYGLLAGMSPSTQRAVIMVSVGLVAMLAQRDRDLPNTLAAAALIIVLISPPALFTVSFQLSFAAVLAIAWGWPCVPEPWRRAGGRVGTVLLGCFWASLLALMGTVPLVMAYFNQVSLVGLGANMILVPLVGWGVVPTGLVSALAGLIWPSAGIAGFQACASLARVALDLIDFFSGLPFASLKTFTPTVAEMALAYALAAVGLALIRQIRPAARRLGPGVEAARRRRYLSVLLIWALAVLVLLAGLDTLYWLHRRLWHRDLRVTVLDVGQGSAALAEFPGGHTMLIDGGGFSDNAIFDVGKRLVAPVLCAKRIFTVDTVVLSHPNADHVNGLVHILSKFEVGRVWTNNEPAPTKGYGDFIRAMERQGFAAADFSSLARRQFIGGVRVDILHPPPKFDPDASEDREKDTNDRSLVLRLEKDGLAILFPGDITHKAEADLVRAWGGRMQSSVLVVPHHGSRRSSSPAFLDAVRPDLAVVSAGWRNRFGFPHPQVLQRLSRHRCKVLRTDRHGAVSLSILNGRMRVGTEGYKMIKVNLSHSIYPRWLCGPRLPVGLGHTVFE